MMMRKYILPILMLCPVMMMGQSARTEIASNPALAAGKYYAYEAPDTRLTPAPKGYKPFYISAFARHGSRYLTKEKKYSRPLSILLDADDKGVLTPTGKRALKVIATLAAEAEGRYGELTPKGAMQHRGLVERMYDNYGAVFAGDARVDARSTYKTRAFLSMATACAHLKGLNPELRLTMDASQHDAYFIKYKNPLYEAMHLDNIDSVYRAADSVYIHPGQLMAQLFDDSTYVADNIDAAELMQDLFELNGISQSSIDAPDLGFLFNTDELYDMWQRNNFEWYYEKGASPLSDNCMYRLERNLLENFITCADDAIASGTHGATLRYGHDTNLAPLAVLMGIDSLQTSTADWQAIANTYRTYKIIPMCGNVQVIFFRKKNSDDIIVKILLNEREVTLPVKSDIKPYYHWSDVRKLWTNTVKSIDLPPVVEGD